MDVPIAPSSHGDVLQLVIQLTLLLGLARLLGELARDGSGNPPSLVRSSPG